MQLSEGKGQKTKIQSTSSANSLPRKKRKEKKPQPLSKLKIRVEKSKSSISRLLPPSEAPALFPKWTAAATIGDTSVTQAAAEPRNTEPPKKERVSGYTLLKIWRRRRHLEIARKKNLFFSRKTYFEFLKYFYGKVIIFSRKKI